jgi:hypothetical protein
MIDQRWAIASRGMQLRAFRNLRTQPETRAKAEVVFFYFFGGNPLKSHNSKKLMKANESSFAFIHLHFLSFICRDLAPRLHQRLR